MILAYHELASSPVRDVYALPAETFRRHALLVSTICGSRPCVTFDDGHQSQFGVAAAILNEQALSGLFFVSTAWIGHLATFMTWRELRELQFAGHTIGSHGHTHAMLTTCGNAALRNELTVSKDILEQQIGVEIDSLSVPGGRVDTRVLNASWDAGYRRVYTSRVGEHSPGGAALPEVIGRFVVRRATSDRTVAAYLSNDPYVCRRLQIESAAKELLKKITGDALYQRLWRKAVRSESYGS